MRLFKLCAAFSLFLLPAAASADPCAGASPFADVAPGASYCTNTEWLANRKITLGCDATNFCPDLPVTRAAMALFMNRLGDALLTPPVSLEEDFDALTLTLASNDNPVCQTSPLPAVNYPRIFSMTGHVTVLGGAASNAVVGMHVRRSINGGGFASVNTYSQRTTTNNAWESSIAHSGVFTVPAGSTVAAHLGIFTVSGSTSIGSGRCLIVLRGQSVTGTSSPFDALPRRVEGD